MSFVKGYIVSVQTWDHTIEASGL